MEIANPVVERTSAMPAIASGAVVRATDAVSLLLLLSLLVSLWFDRGRSFDSAGAIVGVTGLMAAMAARARLRTFLDWPLLGYGGLTVLAAVVAGSQRLAGSFDSASWHPAVHTAVLVAYFYAATWILRTSTRIAVVLTIVVVAISLAGVQAAYDHVSAGLEVRFVAYTSTSPWMAYPDLGMLFALALPVPLSVAVVARSKRVMCAAMVVAVMFWIDQVWVYSRSGYLSALAGCLAVAAVELVRLRRVRLIGMLIAFVVIIGLGAARSATLNRVVETFGDRNVYDTRLGVWHRTLAMIADHPWVGVGPGHYVAAMRSRYPSRTWNAEDDLHAHNMLLHTAAESGMPALLAFLLMWLKLFRRLWLSAISPGPARAGIIGVFGLLVAFFVRGLTDHFMSELPISDRVAFLLWTFIAAGVAATRLPAEA